MEEKNKHLFIGAFFLFIQLVAIVRNIGDNYYNFFWFCDFVPITLAIGFFLKKDSFIKSIVNIGLIAQLMYVSFYIYKLFFGVSLIDTIPPVTTFLYTTSSILIHLSTTFALMLTHKVKPTIKTLFSSLMFLFGMYVVALFFTTTEQRVNYVLSSRTLIPLVIPHYTELWVLLTFLVVVLPTQLIQYLIYRKSNGKFVSNKINSKK